MNKGIVIDIDHMSALSFNDTMELVTPKKYPVVSGHTGFNHISLDTENHEGQRSDAQIPKILNVGGMFAVIPHQGDRDKIVQFPTTSSVPNTCGNSSQAVAHAYRYAISRTGGGPVAFGTDLNGFAGWPSPRFGPEACSGGTASGYDKNSKTGRLPYPFTITASGVNITSTQLDPGPSLDSLGTPHPGIDAVGHSVVGKKTFDFNTDGFAQVGLLPDLIADMETMGVQPEELDPLFLSGGRLYTPMGTRNLPFRGAGALSPPLRANA